MDKRKEIADILGQHKGKQNPITVAEISQQVNVKDGTKTKTSPTTRAMIKQVINSFSLPIGSCPGGYFVITNAAELAEYTHSLESRINGIKSRIWDVRAAYARRAKGENAGKTKTRKERQLRLWR
jgi:hypothetical protein